jgi:hypothetical protein
LDVVLRKTRNRDGWISGVQNGMARLRSDYRKPRLSEKEEVAAPKRKSRLADCIITIIIINLDEEVAAPIAPAC